jgi:hypothetical protein
LSIIRLVGFSLNLTLGGGIYANAVFADDFGISGGLRVPIGANIMLAKKVFEVFFHVAPSFGVNFLPSLDLSDPFFPLALGVRFWFR